MTCHPTLGFWCNYAFICSQGKCASDCSCDFHVLLPFYCHFVRFCYTRWQHLYNFLFCQICCRTICKEENSLLLEQYFVSVRCEFAVGIANAIPAVVDRCRLTVSTMTATALKGASGECIVYSEIKQLDGDNNNG